MKNVSMAIGLISALLLASTGSEQNIAIGWNTWVSAVGNGWLPKIASDGSNGLTTLIYQIDTGMARFEYTNGELVQPYLFYWNSPNNINSSSDPGNESGHAPSIAMVTCYAYECMGGTSYTANVVEVHQGGQDGGAQLWYRTGVVGIDPTGNTTWGAAQTYDMGYNPTVAVDQNSISSSTATVVEVHQAAADSSELWFHIGTLTYSASSVSVTLGDQPAKKTGLTGYTPSVSYSNGVAVLVARGPSAELWYSIGTWDTSGNFVWGPATSYSTGYNPSVSLQSCPGGGRTSNTFNCIYLLVEAHQDGKDTGTLYYRTGILTGVDGTSTTITWTPNKDRKIGSVPTTGCYPTVSLITNWSATPPGPYYNVVESHSAACGGPANLTTWLGTLTPE